MMERTTIQSAALLRELRNVMRQAEELVTALGEDRDEVLVQIRNRVSVTLSAAKIRLAELDERTQHIRQHARLTADIYARENPWTVVSVGAALGLILGAWITPYGGRAAEK